MTPNAEHASTAEVGDSAETAQTLVHTKPIPLRLTGPELEEARTFSQRDDRSASSFARRMYRLGLQQFKAAGAPSAPAQP
ncbi:hypothetical protein [Raoultella sp. 18083]|uniref:hypothetical protein n=1 Tax=Raoultella sp. 18083 TaxID=2681462 RepID=UPI0013570BEF|nr:hypothetical protein [Raoultella sp. 18083]